MHFLCTPARKELAPESFQVHYNMARALVRLGRLEEAAQHYSRAIELNPGMRSHFVTRTYTGNRIPRIFCASHNRR